MTASDRADIGGPFETKHVSQLDVRCSLRVRSFLAGVWSASDTCQKPATSAVEDAKTRSKLWRCDDHRGVLTLGPVHTTVTVRIPVVGVDSEGRPT